MGFFDAAELISAGCLAGFLSGFFGVEEGLTLIPALLYFYRIEGVSSLVSTQLAIGTSLFVTICAEIVPIWRMWGQKHVLMRAFGFGCVGCALGALAGGVWAGSAQGDLLRKLVAGAIFLAVIRLVSGSLKGKGDPEPQLTGPGLLAIGLIGGCQASLTGVDGSGLVSSLMSAILRVPQKKAAATSKAIAIVGTVVATAAYLQSGWGNEFAPAGSLGFVDWVRAIPLAVGLIPASLAGAAVSTRGISRNLRRFYAIVLLVIMVRLLLM